MLPRSFKGFWKRSQTKIWAIIQLASGGFLASIKGINDAVSNPHIKEYLDQVDLPKTAIAALLGIGLLTYLFHGHGDD